MMTEERGREGFISFAFFSPFKIWRIHLCETFAESWGSFARLSWNDEAEATRRIHVLTITTLIPRWALVRLKTRSRARERGVCTRGILDSYISVPRIITWVPAMWFSASYAWGGSTELLSTPLRVRRSGWFTRSLDLPPRLSTARHRCAHFLRVTSSWTFLDCILFYFTKPKGTACQEVKHVTFSLTRKNENFYMCTQKNILLLKKWLLNLFSSF